MTKYHDKHQLKTQLAPMKSFVANIIICSDLIPYLEGISGYSPFHIPYIVHFISYVQCHIKI